MTKRLVRFRSEDAFRMELWPAAPFTASLVETEAVSNAVMPADEVSLRTLSARGRSRNFQVSRRSKVKCDDTSLRDYP